VFFGCVQRDLPFEHVFESHDRRLAFAEGDRWVRAFGMNDHSNNPKKAEILEQARYASADDAHEGNFVLEFTFKGGGTEWKGIVQELL